MKRELMGGINGVEALLTHAPQRVVRIWMKSGQVRLEALKAMAQGAGVPVEISEERALEQRLPGVSHQGVVAEFQPMEPLTEAQLLERVEEADRPLLLVLDGVQDPQNLGACLRSAAAAAATAVVITKDRATGLTPAARKASAGASEIIPLAIVTNLARTLQSLQKANMWTVGLNMGADESLFSVDVDRWLTGPVALVMGGEGSGLRRLTSERCDKLVSIPMPGVMESLNVSVAAAIALFCVVRARSHG